MEKKNEHSKPKWLKMNLGAGNPFSAVGSKVRGHGLNTICEEAKCPNRAQCWREKTATFLILGAACTRGCAFCAVKRSSVGETVENEPERVAGAVRELGIEYAVITSVTRDDLSDGGAAVFAETCKKIGELPKAPLVELLIPDLTGENLRTVAASGPAVIAHNVETVKRLSPLFRHRNFSHGKSLSVLREIKELDAATITKSSLLLGLGENFDEILETMDELRAAGVDILVAGQYLRPSPSNAAVISYITPETFEEIERVGLKMGFSAVASSPFSRTSHLARRSYLSAAKRLEKHCQR